MALDVLPDALQIPTRPALVARVKADMQFRAPTIVVTQGTLPDIDAAWMADALMPFYAEAVRQAENGTLDGMTTQAELDQECIDSGLPTNLPAAGASGFFVVTASTGGGLIQAGDEIRNKLTGIRYRCTQTAVYTNGSNCPITAIDVGPQTNLAPGTLLTVSSPRPGITPDGTVYQQSDGSGLTGGALQETLDQQRARIRASRANPAVSGNDAAYQLAALGTLGLAVQQAFTYPAIVGSGTGCVIALLRPSAPGASRIPTTTQIAAIKAQVLGQMPKDDSVAFALIIAQPIDLILKVRWSPGVAAWSDAVPWPPYSAFDTYKITNTTTPTATSFSIGTTDPGWVAPQVGNNIALYNAAAVTSTTPSSAFVVKRILSVVTTSPGHWTVGVDTSNNASDTQFVPAVGDPVGPWSASLGSLVLPVVQYFDALGPGEQVATFYDPGFRQKRSPADPAFWPASLTTKVLVPILDLPAILDAQVASPVLPFAPNVGVPYVSSNLLTLNHLAVYAE